jgi:glucose/arabinose dehydrogenase
MRPSPPRPLLLRRPHLFLLPLLLCAGLLLLACGRGGKAASPPALRLEPAFPLLAFDQPVGMVQDPLPSPRWYLLEKKGRVLAFEDNAGATAASVFLDLSARVDSDGSEMGLLGMAFHPRYAASFQAFLSYTGYGARAGSLILCLSRFSSADSGRTLDPGSEKRILTVPQPFRNHKGGQIAFGPDGSLTLALGDGGSAGDPLGNAQDTHSLLGKFLRLDVDGGDPYAIPSQNPFAGSPSAGRPEILAWGLSNPRRWSFDRATGRLWAGDAGQASWEEVDVIVPGGNYGWPLKEGKHCFSAVPCDTPGLTDPVAEYGHREGCAIIGGCVYRGSAIPSLAGAFVYADFCSGKVWALPPAASGGSGNDAPRLLLDTSLNISSFAEDRAGELYLLDYAGGKVYRLAPVSPARR